MRADLFAELMASVEITDRNPQARAWRESKGWPRRATLQGLGGGVARIEGDPFSGLYQPVREGGQGAIVIPAWEGPAPGQPDELIDLAAWAPDSGAIFTRCGIADLLGEYALWRAGTPLDDGKPLRVYADPGAWARAAEWGEKGGHGVVILDWANAWSRLGHLPRIVCDDLATARRLKKALQPPAAPKPPAIYLDGPAAGREAA